MTTTGNAGRLSASGATSHPPSRSPAAACFPLAEGSRADAWFATNACAGAPKGGHSDSPNLVGVIALEVMMDYRALFAFIDASGSPESHGDGLTVDATRVVAGQEDDRIGDFLAGDDSSGRILSRPFTPHFLKGGIVAIGLKLC